MPKGRFWLYMGAVAVGAGLLVSAQSLGMTMPWQAAQAADMDKKADKRDVEHIGRRVDRLESGLSEINGKLDILIQLQTK